jgi:Carbohydrate-selective porin, OprB family
MKKEVFRIIGSAFFCQMSFQNNHINHDAKLAKYFKYGISIITIIFVFLNASSSQAQSAQPTGSNLKISGEALFGATGYGGVTPTKDRSNSQAVFDNRVRLNIEAKFTPEDRLKIRLESGNSTPLNRNITGTNMTRLGYDGAKNQVSLSLLQYQFPLSDRTQAVVEITGSGYSDNLDNFSPLASSSTGAISRFGRYQPIYRLSNDGTGLTVKHQFSPQWSATASYTAPSLTAANPSDGGLFGGANAAIGQVKYAPSKDFKLGLTYARSYHPNGSGVSGSTGSLTANNPFNGEATTAQHYGVSANYSIDKDVTVSGWVGVTEAQTANRQKESQSNNIAVSLAANNCGGQGNTLGIIVGVPPKSNQDRDTSIHLEAIYKLKVTENVDITPGILVITNPEHNRNNSSIWVGTIRTTLRF